MSPTSAPVRLRAAPPSALYGTEVLITGCNSGLGRELARGALNDGARLRFTCRSEEKVRDTERVLGDEFPEATIRGYCLDLGEFARVEAFCTELSLDSVQIEHLILNAGIHLPFKHLMTVDGFEIHQQINFLSAALIFLRLAGGSGERLRQVVYVSSDAHRMGHLPAVFPLTYLSRYAKSKLKATTFFLAARPLFPSTLISVISPGNVATAIHRHKHPLLRSFRSLLRGTQSPEEAADDLLDAAFCSSEPEAYWNRGKMVPAAKRCSSDALKLETWNETIASLPSHANHRPYASTELVKNHAETVSRLAPRVSVPSSEHELLDLVRSARESGRRVRVVGSRHSYNDCFYSHSSLLSLAEFTELGPVDPQRRMITVGAGITIRELCDHLDDQGYALPFACDAGQQTFVGAAITGTHGFCRQGGLIAELIVALRVVSGLGEVVSITDEAELRSFRVSAGTLGIVTAATISVERKEGFVEYSLSTIRESELVSRLAREARENEYYRFFRNRFHPDRYTVLTINRTETIPSAGALQRVRHIDESPTAPGLVRGLRYLMRSAMVHRVLRPLPAFKLNMSLVAPYSTYLFLNGGIVDRSYRLSSLMYHAWDDDTTRNMEIAIRPEHLRTFLHIFDPLSEALRARSGEYSGYFTGRYVGRSAKAVLAPNYERDVLFVDVHVSRGAAAHDFLGRLEEKLAETIPIRPHWAKEFSMGHTELKERYPAECWQAFRAMKRKYDPDNLFSNAYTERVYGW